MAPHSPGTDQIDTLLWIGFVAAAIVVVAIVGGLLFAARKYRSERGAEPRQPFSDIVPRSCRCPKTASLDLLPSVS